MKERRQRERGGGSERQREREREGGSHRGVRLDLGVSYRSHLSHDSPKLSEPAASTPPSETPHTGRVVGRPAAPPADVWGEVHSNPSFQQPAATVPERTCLMNDSEP